MTPSAAGNEAHAKLSADEYLTLEERSEERHEYFDGLLVAMTGRRRAHSVVAVNLLAAVRSHLRGGPCRAHGGDFKVRVAAANAFLYPDLLVECEPDADPSALYTSTPKLVVEVLSPTTRDFDRGDKFALYRRCPSLEEYVLVDSERRVVEPFHRREDGTWSIGERMADEGGGRAELCRPAPRHGHDLRGQRRAHGGSAQG